MREILYGVRVPFYAPSIIVPLDPFLFLGLQQGVC